MKIDSRDKDLVDKTLRSFDEVSGDRGVWESHWEEIAERILPEHRNTLRLNSFNTPGMRKTEFQYDSTAAIALSRFSAILTSILTPDNWVWHKVKTTNRELNAEREVRLYFEEVNRVLWDERRRPTANFSGQNYQCNQSLGAYGTKVLFIDENLKSGGMRYKYCHIGRTYIQENTQGQVDRVYRNEKFKGYQLLERPRWKSAIEKFDRDFVTQIEKNPRKEFTVIHHVCPRADDYDPSRMDFRGMEFMSCYILREARILLQEGGYRNFPFSPGRYEQVMDEQYGRSPAMIALPSVKTLNEMKKTVITQGHRIIDPVLFTHDDGVVDALSMQPGAVNPGFVNEDGRMLVGALPTGNLAISKDLMDDERAPINDVFLVSLFQILVENPQMTATEVLERSREKGILLAPSAGRQQSESMGPQITREIDILAAQRRLPPMPQVMIEARGEYDIEYDNDLTRAARAQELAAFERSVQQAIEVAVQTGDRSALDHFDFDAATPEGSQIRGVPERWLKDADEIAAARVARQQQEQMQQAVQAAPGAAAIIKANAVANKGA